MAIKNAVLNLVIKTEHDFSWGKICFAIVCGWFTVIAGIFFSSFNDNPPSRLSLITTEGVITSIETNKYAVRFNLSNSTCQYSYLSKFGNIDHVIETLKIAGDKKITIEHDDSCEVWDISIGQNTIRAYDDSLAAWESENKVGFWLILMMLGLSIFLSYYAWIKYKYRNSTC